MSTTKRTLDYIARLETANAELLAALRGLVPNLEEYVLPGRKEVERARAAIAKAEEGK